MTKNSVNSVLGWTPEEIAALIRESRALYTRRSTPPSPDLSLPTEPVPPSDDTNPKDLIGVTKAPLRFVPPALTIIAAPAMENGAKKYGAYNWRAKKVRYTVYLEATLRHLLALMDHEDYTTDSGIHHLSHIAANISIIADAMYGGNLIDDRPEPGPAARMLSYQDKTQPGKVVQP